MAAENLRKVKILVLGDTGSFLRSLAPTKLWILALGVGKTSLVHLICHGEVLSSLSWTIGCSVDVKVYKCSCINISRVYCTVLLISVQLHDFGPSTSTSSSYFLELWDIGGSPSHKRGRQIFYQNANGRRSYNHWKAWWDHVCRCRSYSCAWFDQSEVSQSFVEMAQRVPPVPVPFWPAIQFWFPSQVRDTNY